MALTLPFPYSFSDNTESSVDHSHLHVPARVRSRVNSGLALSPAIRSIQICADSPNAGSLADPAADEEDVAMKDADALATSKRRRAGEEDVPESDTEPTRDAKKRRVAGGITSGVEVELVSLSIAKSGQEVKVTSFSPEVCQLEKDIAAALQGLLGPQAVVANASEKGDSIADMVAKRQPGCHYCPVNEVQIAQALPWLQKPSEPRAPLAAPITPPSLPSSLPPPPIDRPEPRVVVAPVVPTPSTNVRRSRRLNPSLPPIDTKPRRASPPLKHTLYRQALVNCLRVANCDSDFDSPSPPSPATDRISPPASSTSLPNTSEDVDMQEVDPRTFPKRGCFFELKAEAERRRTLAEMDGEVVWEAAKLDLEMSRKKTTKRRKLAC